MRFYTTSWNYFHNFVHWNRFLRIYSKVLGFRPTNFKGPLECLSKRAQIDENVRPKQNRKIKKVFSIFGVREHFYDLKQFFIYVFGLHSEYVPIFWFV